jgi:hypothetical protein
MATAQEITSEIARLKERLRIARDGLSRLDRNLQSNRAIIARYTEEVATIPAQVLALEAELKSVLATASAGDIVGNANLARDEGANATRPIQKQQILTPNKRIVPEGSGSGTNANPAPTSESDPTQGTNAPVRTAEQIQAIRNTSGLPVFAEDGTVSNLRRNPENGDLYDPGPNYAPAGGPGAAAGNEDSGRARNATQNSIDTLFSTVQSITPQGNILDQYASYTYNISVYLMTAVGYRRLILSAKRNVAGYALLFQSGGASAGSPDGNAAMAGRNPYFSLDYYIDNVEIQGLISGKGTGAPHNSNTLKFTVIEPNGITLVNNLNDAVTDYIYGGDLKRKKDGDAKNRLAPWGGQNYLMVIKFYGYDSNGNLVRGGTQKPDGGSDPNAVIEKYIPFQISSLKFKVGSKAVEYNFECVTPANIINSSSNRGTIPYDLEIAASTLKDALAGELVVTANAADTDGRPPVTPPNTQASVRAIDNATIPTTSGTSSAGVGVLTQQQLAAAQAAPGSGSGYYTPPVNPQSQGAPSKANSAPRKTLTVNKGLFAALNKYQQDLVKDGQQSLADIYEVEFASDALANALVTYSGGVNPSNSAMPKGGSAADQLNPKKQSADFTTNTLRAKAGMQIVQFLDQMARNSTYIQDQQTVVIDPTDGTQKQQGKGGENLAWFQIGFSAEPIDWDFIRNDYAYKIKYVLTPYWVATVDSAYFPRTAFRGVHKSYPYWFTGQNTAIINYEQHYNNLYTRILSGAPAQDTRTSDLGELNNLAKRKFSPRSGQSSQGAEGRTNEPAANAADKLYSPEDLALAEVRIIGDPAWIFQGEVCYGASANRFNPAPFFADGTINSESRQVYFEVNFNLPGDYNLNTGLMEKGKTGLGRT